MSSSHDQWPSKPGLRIRHLNVNHVHNKISEISSILENSGKSFHIFGLSESRLKNEISNTELSIPGYSIIRRDPISHKEIGLAIYIHNSVNFRHVSRLEQHQAESMWLEVCLKRIVLLFSLDFVIETHQSVQTGKKGLHLWWMLSLWKKKKQPF